MNNNRPYCVLILLIGWLGMTHCPAQGFFSTSSVFTEFSAVGIFDNNSFIAAGKSMGTSHLQKIASNGQFLWQSDAALGNAAAIDLAITPDGSTGVLAKNYNNFGNAIAKVDAVGTPLWVVNIADPFIPNGLNRINSDLAGNFYVVGNAFGTNNQLDIRVVKIGPDGTIIWDITYGDPVDDEQVAGCTLLPDGSIAIGGINRESTETDFFLARLDQDGNAIWQAIYPQSGRQSAYGLITTTDGHLALLGYNLLENPTTINLLKANATDGALIWNRSFFIEGGPVIPGAPSVAPVAQNLTQNLQGSFFLSAITGDVEISSGQLLQLDENGRMFSLAALPELEAINDIAIDPSGDLIMVGSNNIGQGVIFKANDRGEILPNKLSGGLFGDANNNCAFTTSEPLLKGWVIEAKEISGTSRYTATDQFGQFSFSLPPGNFKLTVHHPSGGIPFWTACDTPEVIFNAGTLNDVNLGFMGIKPVANCPIIETDIQTGDMSPCTNNTWYIKYRNEGVATAEDVVITVEKSDFTSYLSSSVPLSSQSNNLLLFNIGTLAPGEEGILVLTMFIACEALVGDAVCTRVSATPNSYCLPPSPYWDGSEVTIAQDCDANNDITFTIHNKGLGNMANELEYVIIEDQVILFTGRFQLDANEDTLIAINNAAGRAYWMRTSQSPGLPILDRPTVFADNCNNIDNFDSLRIQLPANEADLFTAQYCNLLGPPDTAMVKLSAFPFGWKPQHEIEPGQEIEYIIRFKNNSNEVAETIILTDTLDANLLDISTLRIGSTSYPVDWNLLASGILECRIHNVNLLPGETGFASFKVACKKNLPGGEVIRNKSTVRFNYSPAIGSNETFHTIGNVLVRETNSKETPPIDIKIVPNPFREQARIVLNGWNKENEVVFTLFAITGKVIKTETFTGNIYTLQTIGLPSGAYFFQLKSEGSILYTGQFIAF